VAGYVLDGYGGVHQLGVALPVATPVYWQGWDIARNIVLTLNSSLAAPAGYVVDGYGAYHPFGAALPVQSQMWTWDAVRGSAGGAAGGGSGRGYPKERFHSPWNKHSPEFFGIVGSGVTDPVANQNVIDAAQAAGARSVRIEFLWNYIEKSPGKFDWAAVDETVRQYDAAGLDVLGILDYNNPIYGGGVHDYPHNPGAYLNFVSQTVKRYGFTVRSWEIWNEENTNFFMTSGVNPCQYAGLLAASYQRIKAIDGSLTVVMGGTSGIDSDYISSVLACGGHADVVAVHPYRGTAPDGSLIARLGALPWPVWVTEFGYQARNVGEGNQASFLQSTFAEVAYPSNVKRAYWYNYQDVSWSPDSFGLRRADGSARPALSAYSQIPKG
jgi:hypothetical protein